VAIAGETVFVGGLTGKSASTIFVVDAADPSAPVFAWQFESVGSNYAPALRVDGNHLFAAGDGLTVYDLRNPGVPRQVFRHKPVADAWFGAVAVSEGFAFLLGRAVKLLDVHDPSQPTVAASAVIAVPDFVAGDRMTARGDFAYLAAGEAGLYVLQRSDVVPAPSAEPPGSGAVYLPWARGGL
jgi:hypothetical protein